MRATEFGSLTVELAECRYPVENPDGDAYAFLTIRETERNREIFSGWMLASSPALNPLEHRPLRHLGPALQDLSGS